MLATMEIHVANGSVWIRFLMHRTPLWPLMHTGASVSPDIWF
jgi:hypothetical protein